MVKVLQIQTTDVVLQMEIAGQVLSLGIGCWDEVLTIVADVCYGKVASDAHFDPISEADPLYSVASSDTTYDVDEQSGAEYAPEETASPLYSVLASDLTYDVDEESDVSYGIETAAPVYTEQSSDLVYAVESQFDVEFGVESADVGTPV